MKPWLEDNDINMHSTHNERKSVLVERFMASILRNPYIDNLADIVNKYNNTHYSTIKIKLADVKSSTYIDFVNFCKRLCSKLVRGSFCN